jgi:hypothetical protein
MQVDPLALAFFAKQEQERRKTNLVLALANNEAIKTLSLLDYLAYCKARDRLVGSMEGATLEYYLTNLLKVLKGEEDLLALKRTLDKIPANYNRNKRRKKCKKTSPKQKNKWFTYKSH